MKGKRRNHSPESEAKVAIEAARGSVLPPPSGEGETKEQLILLAPRAVREIRVRRLDRQAFVFGHLILASACYLRGKSAS